MGRLNLDEMVQFVEHSDSELYGVKILKGEYKDVIYTYGKVNITEDEEEVQAVLKFDYRIEYVPEGLNKKDLEESYNFKNLLGDILKELFEEKFNDESTDTDTKDDN
jgi:hypothetical protein